jgi:hypothetical protein
MLAGNLPSAPTKIAYLFGAGATHAELFDLSKTSIEKGQGLLIKDVSARVIERARADTQYLKDVELVSSTSGSLNIELLISLIENSKVHRWESKTRLLKRLVQQDIESILTAPRIKRFYLHKSVMEFHKHPRMQTREELIGVISLN